MKVILSDKDYKIYGQESYYLCPNCQEAEFFSLKDLKKCPICGVKIKVDVIEPLPMRPLKRFKSSSRDSNINYMNNGIAIGHNAGVSVSSGDQNVCIGLEYYN